MGLLAFQNCSQINFSGTTSNSKLVVDPIPTPTDTPVNPKSTPKYVKLVGNDSVGPARQIDSVGINSAGNQILAGGMGDDSYNGAVWAFRLIDGEWIQQGTKLIGSDHVGESYLGGSVAISGDGKTGVFGGRQDTPMPDLGFGVAMGAAWVFLNSDDDGSWVQQGAKLIGNDPYNSDLKQGCSVSLSGDGNALIVGALNDNNHHGAARVFNRANGIWKQSGPKFSGNNESGYSAQGNAVAISFDGTTAIVGGTNDSNSQGGAVWIFTKTADGWLQQGSKLTANDATICNQQGANLGISVALSADGNTAAVGGYNDNCGKGAIWIFVRQNGIWHQEGSKLVGEGGLGLSSQGTAVAINADGTMVVTGAPKDNGSHGAIWIYKKENGSWSQFGAKMIDPDGNANGFFGKSVSLSADGKTLVTTGMENSTKIGFAWVFNL